MARWERLPAAATQRTHTVRKGAGAGGEGHTVSLTDQLCNVESEHRPLLLLLNW